jgi:hypothetical protein
MTFFPSFQEAWKYCKLANQDPASYSPDATMPGGVSIGGGSGQFPTACADHPMTRLGFQAIQLVVNRAPAENPTTSIGNALAARESMASKISSPAPL